MPCFYDMDTALGLNNYGAEEIKTDAFDTVIKNTEGTSQLLEFAHGDKISPQRCYTVPDNKL